ncbi:MAG: efflux RND transporter periplasmic adaptor subunit [Pirellulales bacterium]
MTGFLPVLQEQGFLMTDIIARSSRIVLMAAGLAAMPMAGHAQAPGNMPPTPVSVLELKPEPLPVINELPGRVSATRLAEVRPRVSGIVVERVFEQGSRVKAGDVLYRIDPAQFRVRVASAEATLARAKASQMNSQVQLKRQQQLRDRNIATGVELDNAVTTAAQADADVAVAEASLAEAKLNLDYTEVRAPINGTIGRATVTEGALVTAQTDIMATIQQLDPVYADFTQSSAELRRLKMQMAAGQLVATNANEARVQLFFDDGTQYEHPGKLLFSEASVEPDDRPGDAARRISQYRGRIVARPLCPHPHRTGGARKRHRHSADGGAARCARQCAGLCGQGRRHGGAAHREARPDPR